MVAAIVANIVKDGRRSLGNLFAYRRFTVQNSHRVAFKSALAGFAKFALVRAEIFTKRVIELGSTFGTTD